MTMKDIARELGISVATVSRALNDNPRISKERREMIQRFAREHNYYPNAIAESLRHSRVRPSRVIGVIVPEIVHYYFSSVLAGVEETAAARGYRIMVACSDELYKREVEICRSFYKNKVCGIIISQAKDTRDYAHFQSLLDSGVPIVFYDRVCVGVEASRVVVDDYAGTFNAVNYLIDTGCRRIAFYGSDMSFEISKNRFNGYKDALLKHKIPIDDGIIRLCDSSAEAQRITPEIMAMAARPDAFFAVNDETAIGVLYAVKRLGYRVPEDVSICGFTDSDKAVACEPQLTTVEQRGRQVGREAAGILIDKAEGIVSRSKVERRMVRTRLIARGTTRAAVAAQGV